MAKKEKKENIIKQAKEAIRKKYELDGIELLSIVGVAVPGKMASHCFGAIDSDQISIYEYTNEKELIELESIAWNDWNEVVIDHFALKSIFEFTSEGKIKDLVINDGNGKQVENIIRNKTEIKVTVVERKWYNKILGFRSGKKWKMIVAAIVYLFIFGGIVNVFSGNSDTETASKKPVAEEVSVDKKVENPKEEVKKEKAKEDKKKDERPIDKKLQEDDKNVDKATLEDGVLTLKKEVTTFWDETSILKQDVLTMFEIFPEAFEDESVNSVNVVLLTEMVDEKGNGEIEPIIEFEYSKDAFDELNYEKFLYMATSETWRILNESDAYWIHPGIYKNVKDEYRNNLKHSMTKIKE